MTISMGETLTSSLTISPCWCGVAGDHPTPLTLSPRVTRWTIFLAAYSYWLVHQPGNSLSHADALSRCPLPELLEDPAPAAMVLLIEDIAAGPITAAEIARHSYRETHLKQFLNYVLRDWPTTPLKGELQLYHMRQTELSVMKGCLLCGERVVIPPKLQWEMLEVLHVGHLGIVRMKALARRYVWWPNMDQDITEWVATCTPCQDSRPAPPSAPTEECGNAQEFVVPGAYRFCGTSKRANVSDCGRCLLEMVGDISYAIHHSRSSNMSIEETVCNPQPP